MEPRGIEPGLASGLGEGSDPAWQQVRQSSQAGQAGGDIRAMASSNELMDEWMAGFGSGQSSSGFLTTQRERQDPNTAWSYTRDMSVVRKGLGFCSSIGTKDLSAFLIDLRLKAERKGWG